MLFGKGGKTGYWPSQCPDELGVPLCLGGRDYKRALIFHHERAVLS